MRLRANTPLHGDREKPGAERAAAGDFDLMFLPNAPAEVYQLYSLQINPPIPRNWRRHAMRRRHSPRFFPVSYCDQSQTRPEETALDRDKTLTGSRSHAGSPGSLPSQGCGHPVSASDNGVNRQAKAENPVLKDVYLQAFLIRRRRILR
jgi:hypothetical protein